MTFQCTQCGRHAEALVLMDINDAEIAGKALFGCGFCAPTQHESEVRKLRAIVDFMSEENLSIREIAKKVEQENYRLRVLLVEKDQKIEEFETAYKNAESDYCEVLSKNEKLKESLEKALKDIYFMIDKKHFLKREFFNYLEKALKNN